MNTLWAEEAPPAAAPSAPAAPAKVAMMEGASLIKVGDVLPATMSLVDVDGKAVTVASLHEKGPVVMIVYRGGWCPFCTKEMKEWNNRLDDVKAAGASVVAVSIEKAERVKATVDKENLKYTLLIDDHAKMTKALGLGVLKFDDATKQKYKGYGVELDKGNTTGEWELPYPATLVIDQSGTVRFVEQSEDYRKRPDIAKVMEVVKSLKK